MGKKNANPADAHRKAMKKKEKERNKEARTKAREVKTLKTDTGELSAEIRKLEESKQRNELDKSGQARLSELRSELERVRKAKSDYVEKHPEHRKLIYGERKDDSDERGGGGSGNADSNRSLFKKNGLPKHPERSIYYDPILNPFGMPPPGLPYIERPLLPHEIASTSGATLGEEEAGGSSDESSDDEDDSDSDVPLLEGAKGDEGQEDDSEDDNDSLKDIPLPPGPPPSKTKQMPAPPLPPGPPPPLGYTPTFDAYGGMIPPPPPVGFTAPNYQLIPPPPPPPAGFAMSSYPMGVPPPPPGFAPSQISQPHHHSIPQTYPTQQHHPPPRLPTKPSLPPPPPGLPTKPGSGSSGAVISAEPELRDFKKESTAFVPAALKRKQQQVEKDKDGGSAGVGKKARLEES